MVIVWEIESDYGHFSHPATIYSSLTYPIPPKTVVMGMLGAMAGEIDYTPLNSMRYAVSIERLRGKKEFCFNGIKEVLSQLNPIKSNGFRNGRKQFYRELLISPKYKIFCDLSDVEESFRDKILEVAQKGISLYPLYMGVNFALAKHKILAIYEGSFEEEIKGSCRVSSAVSLDSDFELESDRVYSDVRMATTVNSRREFGGFRDYLVELSGRDILCRDIKVSNIDGEYIEWS